MTTSPPTLSATACPCGDAHLDRPQAHAALGRVANMPAGVRVGILGQDGAWFVPRAWIAFHGLRAEDVPRLAQQYGWARVK